MSDHFKFDIRVSITDRIALAYGQKDRGDEIKKDCAYAVRKVLEDHGFREYRDEYYVTV